MPLPSPLPPPQPAIVVICRLPNDPGGREWSLVREDDPGGMVRWALVFRRAPPSPPVILPLPAAAPDVTADRVLLDYQSANGGRSVAMAATAAGGATLDVFVNFELEVNVERDLDRRADEMNTDGPLSVTCTFDAVAGDTRDGDAHRREGPPRGDEWMAGVGYSWSIDLLQSAGGRRSATTSVSWGRDLTQDAGPGVLRGRLLWAVEVVPLHWQQAPTRTTGVGLLPLVWRWRFVPRPRWAPFAELAFGGLFTSDPVPEGTESANFIAHGAFGVRWRPGRRTSLVTAYRLHHLSNGNQLTSNPGVNAHVLWVGVAFGPGPPVEKSLAVARR